MEEGTSNEMPYHFIATARHLDKSDNDQPDPFRVETDILWLDFKAVVIAQYDHPPKDVVMKYLDEDNEMVTMNSQEELVQAMWYAGCNGGIMQLEVRGVVAPDEPKERKPVEQIDATLILPAIPRNKTGVLPSITVNRGHVFSSDTEETVEPAQFSETGELNPNSHRDEETGLVIEKNINVAIKEECVDKVDVREDSLDSDNASPAESDYERMADTNVPDNVSDSMPYPAFVQFMEKLKQELRNEIVHDVTKKTVKQVLRGLDNIPWKCDKGPWASKKEDIKHAHPIYLHEGTVCNHCEKTILGPRYKCGNCADYDLCEKCESKYGIHNPEHVFIKLRRPCKDNLYRDGKKTPLLKRVLYKAGSAEPLERMMDRKQEKMKRKVEKMFEKEKRKEEKLKRKLEKYDGLKDSPKKRERYEINHTPLLQHIKYCNKEYKTLGAAFVRDITIPDGTTVQPGTKMIKTWRLLNTGSCTWRETTMLRLMYGTIPAIRTEVLVPCLKPGEEGDVTAELTAPELPGRYQSHWKLFDKGLAFGHRVWVMINVVPREILEPKPIEPLRVVMIESEVQNKAPEEQTVVRDTETIETSKSPIPLYRLIPSMLDEVDNDEEQIKIVDTQPSPINDLNKQDSVESSSLASKINSLNVDVTETDNVELNLTSAVAAMEKLTVSEPIAVPSVHEGKDLLSFEFLDRTPPKVSQTATPNNTPLDVSPPKSPITTPRLETVLSASSSMEMVNVDAEESVPLLEEYPHERIQSLEFRPSQSYLVNDVESLDSFTDDDSSCSDDFFVVPLPDCFDTSKPLTRSTVVVLDDIVDENQNEVVEAVQPSVDDLLQVSASVDIRPLTPEVTSPEIVRDIPEIEASAGEAQPTIINISDGAVGESVESQPLDSSCYAAAGGQPLTEEEHQTRVLQIDEGCSQPDPAATTSTNTNNNQADASATAESTAEQQEFAKQLFDVAITTAANAASNAYFKVKEVIHTWQVKDMERQQQQQTVVQTVKVKTVKKEWTPPKQEFKPPKNDWSPPEDNYIPPQSTWTLPSATYVPKSSNWPREDVNEAAPIDQMLSMGFCNRDLNQELLQKHNNDVGKAISELLEMHKEDWASNRH